MTPAAATGSDCVTALVGLLMIIFVMRLMIVTRRRNPSLATLPSAQRDTAAASEAPNSDRHADATTEAAAVSPVRNAGSARRAGALWLTASAEAARNVGRRRAEPGTARRPDSGRTRRGGPATGRRPRRSLVSALAATIAVSAVAVQYAAPAADAQVVSHQPGPQPGQHSQLRTRSGQAAGRPPTAESRPPDVSSLDSVNQLIADQQRRLARERAVAHQAAWEQVANAATFAAKLHQYIAGLWQQAHRDLNKLRAASDAETQGQLADAVRQAITKVRDLQQLEAQALRQQLSPQARQHVDDITPELPAGVGTMIRNVVAVQQWLTSERLERIGVWVAHSASGQPTLLGYNPAFRGVGDKIKAKQRQIASIKRQIRTARFRRNATRTGELRVRKDELGQQLNDLEAARERQHQAEAAARQRAEQAAGDATQIQNDAARALATPPQMSPGAIRLNAIVAMAAQATTPSSDAHRRAAIIDEATALRGAMITVATGGALTSAERKRIHQARIDVEVLKEYLSKWLLTGPRRVPQPPQSTIERRTVVKDDSGKVLRTDIHVSHPENMKSPVTDPENPLQWGDIFVIEYDSPPSENETIRLLPGSTKSQQNVRLFVVTLGYLGTRYLVRETSGQTQVRLRGWPEIWRVNPPAVPDLPSDSPPWQPGDGWSWSLAPYIGPYIGSSGSVISTTRSGRLTLKVRKIAADKADKADNKARPDGLPRRWTRVTPGNPVQQAAPRTRGPRLPLQLKGGSGVEVNISRAVTANDASRLWNGLAEAISAVAGPHVQVPRLPVLPHGPKVAAVNLTFQIRLKHEIKYPIFRTGKPALSTGYEFVITPSFRSVGLPAPPPFDFSGSLVPAQFVIGRSLANWQDVQALADKILTRLPGLSDAKRREIAAALRGALAHADLQVRADAAAQQLAAGWLTRRSDTKVTAAAGHLSAAGRHPTIERNTVRMHGVQYHIVKTSAIAPDRIASAAAASYRQGAAAHQPGLTGLIIMAGPRAPPADTTQLRDRLDRMAAGRWGAGQPYAIFYIDRDGNVTQLTGPPPPDADRATVDVAAQLAVHGHQVDIWPGAGSDGHDIISSDDIPYILYAPPADATPADIASGAADAYQNSGTTPGHTTRPSLLIHLADNSQATADDIAPAIAPYARDLPFHILVLGPDRLDALTPAVLHSYYPALQTTSGTTYAVYPLTITHGSHASGYRLRRSATRKHTRQLTRQVAKAASTFQKAVRNTPPGRAAPRGLDLELRGIEQEVHGMPATPGIVKTILNALARALSTPGAVLPDRLIITDSHGDQAEYQITRSAEKIEIRPLGQTQPSAPHPTATSSPAMPPASQASGAGNPRAVSGSGSASGVAPGSPSARGRDIKGLIVGGGRIPAFPSPPHDAITLNNFEATHPHVVGDIKRAPFKPDSFKYVYFENVGYTSFTGANSGALAETARILKPEGNLQIDTNASAPVNEIITNLNNLGLNVIDVHYEKIPGVRRTVRIIAVKRPAQAQPKTQPGNPATGTTPTGTTPHKARAPRKAPPGPGAQAGGGGVRNRAPGKTRPRARPGAPASPAWYEIPAALRADPPAPLRHEIPAPLRHDPPAQLRHEIPAPLRYEHPAACQEISIPGTGGSPGCAPRQEPAPAPRQAPAPAPGRQPAAAPPGPGRERGHCHEIAGPGCAPHTVPGPLPLHVPGSAEPVPGRPPLHVPSAPPLRKPEAPPLDVPGTATGPLPRPRPAATPAGPPARPGTTPPARPVTAPAAPVTAAPARPGAAPRSLLPAGTRSGPGPRSRPPGTARPGTARPGAAARPGTRPSPARPGSRPPGRPAARPVVTAGSRPSGQPQTRSLGQARTPPRTEPGTQPL
ncbi:MAG TPA: hypothetical protein VHU92_04585, partial [Streptosporangiaceae bacterium]|nr:hypothetical protein [Streptosporangiaceae bacterium]